MKNTWVLAQTESQQGTSQIGAEPMSGQPQEMTGVDGSNTSNQTDGQQGQPPKPSSMLPLILIGTMLIFMFVSMRGPKKKQQEHKKMLQALQKNDRVRTIGGIYGVVMEVKGDEVILKIDESNNTKIRISNSAISMNLSKENQ